MLGLFGAAAYAAVPLAGALSLSDVAELQAPDGRTFFVCPEVTSISILVEQRTHLVAAETREYEVPAEDRELGVETESRELTVPADPREFLVPVQPARYCTK